MVRRAVGIIGETRTLWSCGIVGISACYEGRKSGGRAQREACRVTGDLPVGGKVEGTDGVVEAVAVSTELTKAMGLNAP